MKILCRKPPEVGDEICMVGYAPANSDITYREAMERLPQREWGIVAILHAPMEAVGQGPRSLLVTTRNSKLWTWDRSMRKVVEVADGIGVV